MPEAVRLEHVGIRATPETMDATLAFYSQIFGWRVIRELPSTDPNVRFVFIGDGHGGRLEVFTAAGPAMTNPTHLAFAVPVAEFAALEQRLTDAGVAFTQRTANTAGDQIAFFEDPSGNNVQIVGRNEVLPV